MKIPKAEINHCTLKRRWREEAFHSFEATTKQMGPRQRYPSNFEQSVFSWGFHKFPGEPNLYLSNSTLERLWNAPVYLTQIGSSRSTLKGGLLITHLYNINGKYYILPTADLQRNDKCTECSNLLDFIVVPISISDERKPFQASRLLFLWNINWCEQLLDTYCFRGIGENRRFTNFDKV